MKNINMDFDINKIINDAKKLDIEVLEKEGVHGKLYYRDNMGELVEFNGIELLNLNSNNIDWGNENE